MAQLRTITEFKTALSGGGARPNLFEVTLTRPPVNLVPTDVWNNQTSNKFSFLCKAANLPASNIGVVDMPFRGRTLKLAGDRTFDPWIVTIINDEDFTIRNAFELWMNGISKLDNNTGATNPDSYMTNADVIQLGRGAIGRDSTSNVGGTPTLVPLKKYTFFDIFPSNISAIDLSYDSADSVEEFSVEFQVQYWTTEFTSAAKASSQAAAPTTPVP